jgi:hypothetical protein
MFCDEFLEFVDDLAAADARVEPRVAAHLASCAGCTSALESARRVDRLLRERQVPPPPAQFTSRIMGRIRRERWRRDQFLDVGFNVVVGLIVVAVVAAFWVVLSRSGLNSVTDDVAGMMINEFIVVIWSVGPSLPMYAAAGAVLATALGLWWWAERDATPET